MAQPSPPYSVHSWSGGKDSALSFWLAQQAAHKQQASNEDVDSASPSPTPAITTLLTAVDEQMQRTRSHAICLPLMRSQSAALNCSIEFYGTSWETYEADFVRLLTKHRQRGATQACFGDIDLDPNREWEEKVRTSADSRNLFDATLDTQSRQLALGAQPACCRCFKVQCNSCTGGIASAMMLCTLAQSCLSTNLLRQR